MVQSILLDLNQILVLMCFIQTEFGLLNKIGLGVEVGGTVKTEPKIVERHHQR